MSEELTSISDLIHDEKNANKGTERGREMLSKSLQRFGFGRSLLLDKNNKIIAGNKTTEAAGKTGFEKVRIIESDGKEIIAVKRVDLDLDKDPTARELAFADNRVAEVDLDWNPAEITAAIQGGCELSDFFSDIDMGLLTGNFPEGQDPFAEWKGMPEFNQEDKEAFKSIMVHFKNEADIAAFAELVKQKVTTQTKSIWYPPAEVDKVAGLEYTDEP